MALQRFAQHQADVLALCAEGDLLVSGSPWGGRSRGALADGVE